MTEVKKVTPTKLLWVDLEMTGLDPNKDVVLEIAAVITDFNFTSMAEYKAVVKHPEAVLTTMNEWSQRQHDKSGLTDRCRNEGVSEAQVIQDVVALVQQHFGDEPAVLAGNSIHSDRGFIKVHWPQVDRLLHYRMLDVTSLKVLMQGKYGIEFAKKESHRADDDIIESIAELEYYLEWLKGKQ